VSFRQQVLLLAGGLLAATLTAVGIVLVAGVARPLAQAEEARLLADLTAAVTFMELRPGLAPAGLVSELDDLLGARVMLVAPDGTVLADSGVPGGDVRGMENHGGRPEVMAALAGRTEVVDRPSPTQGVRALYAAAPVLLGGQQPVVIRLSRPVAPVLAPARQIVLALGGMGAVSLLLLAAGAGLLQHRLERQLETLRKGTLGMEAGSPGGLPDRDAVGPEFRPLVGALRRLEEEVLDRLRGLERERDEMQALVDSIAEGVIALTGDARVLRMNRAAADLLEVRQPSDFAPIGALVRHPELRDHLEEAVVLPLPAREFLLGGRHLRVSSHPLPGGGAVVTFLDVTDLRRMEKIRRDFVANASHELKTPLTAMRGFAETLLEGDPPEHLRQEFLGSIRSNTVRLQNLVDDLLDLSRLESGAWKVEDEETEVAATAREVWEELERHQRDRALDFRVEGDAVALADGQALHQIFRNLLENAVRFTPDGGSIRVGIEARGPEVVISVTDSGAGIPSSALPRIFERFYRVDAGRGRGAGGTGLGLAIVRHLVQSMGGEVAAESRLGEGTTIRFTLPRVETE
jgi:two-component system, OmpR family, phosphate regulon sensor histidine kinase PhoR